MKIETIVTQKLITSKEERQKLENALQVLDTLDNNTDSKCEVCPLARMCNSAPTQVGCLIHYSQKIFHNILENT